MCLSPHIISVFFFCSFSDRISAIIQQNKCVLLRYFQIYTLLYIHYVNYIFFSLFCFSLLYFCVQYIPYIVLCLLFSLMHCICVYVSMIFIIIVIYLFFYFLFAVLFPINRQQASSIWVNVSVADIFYFKVAMSCK